MSDKKFWLLVTLAGVGGAVAALGFLAVFFGALVTHIGEGYTGDYSEMNVIVAVACGGLFSLFFFPRLLSGRQAEAQRMGCSIAFGLALTLVLLIILWMRF